MKTVFLKLSIFSLILIINLVIIMTLPIPYFSESKIKDAFLAILVNKNDILKKTAGGRIIIVGGSGTYYNINCKKIQDEIGITVINKGLFAGFGLRFILEEMCNNIKKGDKIILIPEYALLSYKDMIYKCDENSLKWIFAINPFKSIKYFYNSNKLNILLLKATEYIQDKFKNIYIILKKVLFLESNRKINFGYGNNNYNSYINENGDKLFVFADHLMVDKITEKLGVFPDRPVSDAIKLLNNFNMLANKKGAKVYFYFSCYPKSEINNKNEKQLNNYYEVLNRELNFKVLCRPERTLFDDEYFLDTVNHLNSRGGKIMNKNLAEDIKKYVLEK